MIKAIFTNSFGILFSRILGFLRDLLTASYLGANIYSDIFFIAFKLPNLFRRIFAEGAFSQVFIPSFTHSKHKGVFLAHIFGTFLTIIITLSLIVNIFPSFATKLIAVGFDKSTIELASNFVAINFWYLPLIFGVTFLSALLQYKNHFATTAFSTALLNISLIVALLLSKDKEKLDIVYYLSFGVLAGGILQLILHVVAIYKLNLSKLIIGGALHVKQKSHIIKDDIKKFKKEFIPAIWGNSTAQVSAFLDTFLASFLVSGSISYLYYANRVFQLPLALFAIATSVAIFPKISRYIKNQDEIKAKEYMQKAFWFLSFVLVASMLGGFILSKEIVWLLFERGSFTNQDTINASNVLRMYMLGLLPYGLQKLFMLWLYAKRLQLKAAKIATYSLISYVIFALLLIKPMGASGLALAGSISGFVGFAFSIKVFGIKQFLDMLHSKNTLFLLIGSIVFSALLVFLKSML